MHSVKHFVKDWAVIQSFHQLSVELYRCDHSMLFEMYVFF